MTSDFQNKAKQIFDQIKKSQNILLHCHVHPDEDSICSVLAMTKVLRDMNKDVTPILGDSPYPYYLEDLPRKDWLIPKNYTQINLKDFDLFIILDTSTPYFITKLTDVTFPKFLKTIIVDHHQTNSGYADVNLIEPNSIATCQILYRLFRQWQVEIDPITALHLFLGIYADSGGFKYRETNKESFVIASELTKINPNFHSHVLDIDGHAGFIDLKMEGASGLTLIPQLTALDAQTRIVVLTGYASIATAVEAIKLGANYYLTKPTDADEIVAAFHREEGNVSIPITAKPMSVNRLEWEHIQKVMLDCGGNISAAARSLGMHRRTLQRKLFKRPVNI